MQCPNCELENLPGQSHCARCQSPLRLDHVCVVPRRSSVLRGLTRLQSAGWILAGLTRAVRARLPRWRPRTFFPISTAELAWTLIAPGAAYLRCGARAKGWTWLGAWSACLLLTLATVAGGWGVGWLTLAVLLHAGAFLALLAGNLDFEHPILRLAFGALLFLSLQFFVYQPLAWVLGRVVLPLPLVNFQDSPTLVHGDGVLYQGPWLRPDRFRTGDLVVYEIHESGRSGYILREGFGLDRVLATPGDRVDLHDGALTVNGAPGRQPLGPWPYMSRIHRTLAADEYLIIPTRLSLTLNGRVAEDWFSQALIVNHDDIRGRVLCRAWPWWRISLVH